MILLLTLLNSFGRHTAGTYHSWYFMIWGSFHLVTQFRKWACILKTAVRIAKISSISTQWSTRVSDYMCKFWTFPVVKFHAQYDSFENHPISRKSLTVAPPLWFLFYSTTALQILNLLQIPFSSVNLQLSKFCFYARPGNLDWVFVSISETSYRTRGKKQLFCADANKTEWDVFVALNILKLKTVYYRRKFLLPPITPIGRLYTSL